jgi:hypothetical protein
MLPGMSLNVRRFLVLVVAVSAVGVVSACGSSSSGSAGPGKAASAPSTTAAAPAGGDADQFCGVVKQQETLLQGAGLASLLTGGGADAWKTYLDQTTTMNQQLVDAAPAEIQSDVKTLQDATLSLKSTLAANGYDVSKVGSTKLIQLLQTPKRIAATNSLVAYVKAHCGLDLTTPGG